MSHCESKFNESWMPEPNSGCWLWCGVFNCPRGYGAFMHNGKRELAHRTSWRIHFGEIPKDMWVLHRCDTPSCVNPNHLFLGNRSDNMKDAYKKSRLKTVFKKGIKSPSSKVSDVGITYIRSSDKKSMELAKMFGVHWKTIYKIRTYRSFPTPQPKIQT